MAVGHAGHRAAVRGLSARRRWRRWRSSAGGFAIAGAPPFAVFVSEFLILKAGSPAASMSRSGCLAFFVVIAFCAIMFHVNRMAFGRRAPDAHRIGALPLSCCTTLAARRGPVGRHRHLRAGAACSACCVAAATAMGVERPMAMLDSSFDSRSRRRGRPDLLAAAHGKGRCTPTCSIDDTAGLPHPNAGASDLLDVVPVAERGSWFRFRHP